MRLNVQKSKGRLQVGINETEKEKRKRDFLKNREDNELLINAVKEIQDFLAKDKQFSPEHIIKKG